MFFWKKKKPKGGICAVCGHKGLDFLDDGTGSCPQCGRIFVWTKTKTPQSGGLCSKCGQRNMEFREDGTGICPKCSRTFVWDKDRMKSPEKLGTLTKVRYKGGKILFNLAIQNNTKEPITEVHISLRIPSDCFDVTDDSTRELEPIKPGETKTTEFQLLPKKECGSVEVYAAITYYDYASKNYQEVKTTPENLSIICPSFHSMEINDKNWRLAASNPIRIEESAEQIPTVGEMLFDTVNNVVQDMNTFYLPPQITRSGDIFRGVSKFYAEGVEGAKFTAQIEVMGSGGKSKLLLRLTAGSEENLVGFFTRALDEIEKRVSVKHHLVREPSSKKTERMGAIEDVFVVYQDGLLITHHTRRLKPSMDDDILSGMFTAVQQFVADSFGGSASIDTIDKETLGTLVYGNLTIQIEHGHNFYLAVVLSGKEPPNLRIEMKRICKVIGDRYKEPLDSWSGDVVAFKGVNTLLTGFVDAVYS